MEINNEEQRRKFLSQRPQPTAKPSQPKLTPAGRPTFDQRFRAFTSKINSRLRNIAISLVIGGLIGWIFIIIITATMPTLDAWWFYILIEVASCGTVYWYLRRSES